MATTSYSPVAGPNVWMGRDLEGRRDWIVELTPAEIADLESALAIVEQSGIPLPRIDRNAFPLPVLGPRLSRVSEEVERGRGFAVIRGIPVDRHDESECSILAWGICGYLGVGLPQSREGDHINHIIDLTDVKSTPHEDLARVIARGELRVSHHGGRRLWHTDTTDIVALLCLRQAKSGGESWLASAMTVHNIILNEHPECMPALYEGFYYHRLADDKNPGAGNLTPDKVPVFTHSPDAGTACYYIPEPVQRAIDREGVSYSAEARKARDLIEEIPHRPGVKISMQLEPGDLQVIDNRALLHARADYEDWPELERRRHLLRLWLRVPEGRTTGANQKVHSQFERV